jgi:hypothetical protein
MALQHLYLVPIRVCDKEEPRDHFAAGGEAHQFARGQACCGKSGMLCIDIVDAKGDVAVAVTQVIGLAPALVDGQLKFEISVCIAQIDQRESLKIQAICDIQVERYLVERN